MVLLGFDSLKLGCNRVKLGSLICYHVELKNLVILFVFDCVKLGFF